MIIYDFIYAFLFAVLFTVILVYALKKQREFLWILGSFILLLFVTWAGGVWISPFPEIPWLSFLIIALFFTLLLLAVIPPPQKPPSTRSELMKEIDKKEDAEVVVKTMFNLFFAIIIIGLIFAIIFRYK